MPCYGWCGLVTHASDMRQLGTYLQDSSADGWTVTISAAGLIDLFSAELKTQVD